MHLYGSGNEFNPTATDDNCGIASVTNDFNGLSTLAGAVFPAGLTTVIWTITDNSGNTATCTFTVTVEDNEDPTISCVSNQDQGCRCGCMHLYGSGNRVLNPTATDDNCGIASVTNDFNGLSTLAGAVSRQGFTTVIWTITDNSGNTAYLHLYSNGRG
jgi:hypothetical protein